jgi:uncharacterized protein (DUF4415 family)
MSKKKVDPASLLDNDNPEWTRSEIRDARPALDVVADVFGAKAADTIRRRGRPEKPDRKVNQTLRLDPDVNEVLRAHMPKPAPRTQRHTD